MLLQRGLIKKARYEEALALERQRLHRQVTHRAMLDAWVAANNDDGFAGLPVEDMSKMAQLLIQERGSLVYAFTRDLIGACKALGYLTVAISGSAEEAVIAFAQHHKFDIAIGSRYPQADGRYVPGRAEYPAEHKDKVMIRVLKELGLHPRHDQVIAIGDTANDFPMLREARYPIAFEPNGELLDRLCSKEALDPYRPYTIVRDSKDAITAKAIIVNEDGEPEEHSCTLYDFLPEEVAAEMDVRLGDSFKFKKARLPKWLRKTGLSRTA